MYHKDSAWLRKAFFLMVVGAGAAMLTFTPALSQEQPQAAPKVEVKRVPMRPGQDWTVSGPELYRSYCAVCHGQDGKGNGPAAPGLKTQPADLTLLAKNAGGKFPANRVTNILNSEEPVTAHGSKDMPIWGPLFRLMGGAMWGSCANPI